MLEREDFEKVVLNGDYDEFLKNLEDGYGLLYKLRFKNGISLKVLSLIVYTGNIFWIDREDPNKISYTDPEKNILSEHSRGWAYCMFRYRRFMKKLFAFYYDSAYRIYKYTFTKSRNLNPLGELKDNFKVVVYNLRGSSASFQFENQYDVYFTLHTVIYRMMKDLHQKELSRIAKSEMKGE